MISSNTGILDRECEIAFTIYAVYNWVDLGPDGNEHPTALGNLVLNDRKKGKKHSWYTNKDATCETHHSNIFHQDKVSLKQAGTSIYLLCCTPKTKPFNK